MTILEEKIIRNNGRHKIVATAATPKKAPPALPEPEPVPPMLARTRAAAIVIAAAIMTAGFVLSFAALNDLAHRSGITARLAWLFPLAVDGTIVQATTALVALAKAPREVRRFFWATLGAGAAVSIIGNQLHAAIHGPIPALLAAAVATVAPLALLATTHGMVLLYQHNPLSHNESEG